MARGGNVRVRIAADTTDLEKGTKRAERTLGASAKSIGKLGGALAGAFAVGEVFDFGAASIKAYQDAEVSQKKLQAQLKASGISYQAHARDIDAVIQKTSQLSALDDEDLQDAFTNIVRVTGNVDKSMRLVGLAADFARAKHIDVAKAGEIVAKVAGGNTGILSRYGIALDKGASSADALATLQKKFGGQAEAYGKTTAGSIGRLNVAFENLKEKVGGALAPTLAKVADGLATFTTQMQDGTGAGGKFVRGARDVARAASSIASAFSDVLFPVARLLAPLVRAQTRGAIQAIRGFANLLSGIVHGDIKKAFGGILDIAKGLTLPMRTIGAGIGRALWSGVKSTVSGIGGAVAGAASSIGNALRRWINDNTLFGDSIDLPGPLPKIRIPALARGGIVNKPGYFAGEEAPRHPEIILATNPAYRARNIGLWAKAGRALGIPGFAQGGVYSNAELQRLWVQQGGAPSARVLAAAIAQAESSGRAGATNRNTNGTIDRGLWQINSIHGALSTLSPSANARAAVQISSDGRNWRPWVTYNTGAYRRYLQPAVSIAAPHRAGLKLTVRRAGARLLGRSANGIVHAGGASTFIDGETGSSWGSDTSTPEARERLARAELAAQTDTSPGGTDPDLQARLDQAELRAAVARRAQALSDSFLKTITGLGDLGSGSPIVINTLHPGDPATLRAIAGAAAAGFGLQGYTPSPRTEPGL